MIPPCLSSAGGSGRGTNWGLGCLLWRKCAGEPRLMVPARDRTKCHTSSFCSGQVRGSTPELNSLDVDTSGRLMLHKFSLSEKQNKQTGRRPAILMVVLHSNTKSLIIRQMSELLATPFIVALLFRVCCKCGYLMFLY